jgi:hypothetical protein
MTEILLPLMSTEEAEKIEKAILAIGEMMAVDVKLEEVANIKVIWPNYADAFGAIITELVGMKTKMKKGRGKSISLNSVSAEEYSNSKNL